MNFFPLNFLLNNKRKRNERGKKNLCQRFCCCFVNYLFFLLFLLRSFPFRKFLPNKNIWTNTKDLHQNLIKMLLSNKILKTEVAGNARVAILATNAIKRTLFVLFLWATLQLQYLGARIGYSLQNITKFVDKSEVWKSEVRFN